jgi:Domain of unknown function (DUF4426)
MKLAHKIALLTGGALLLLLMPTRGEAEQFKEFGEYIVHYNALSTDQLGADVAKNYQIVRSSRRGLLNIAVLKKSAGEPSAIGAKVSGSAANLAGQRSKLAFREVKEGDAIYYLGEFAVGAGRDTYQFQLEVVPVGSITPYTLKFSKDYISD